MQKETFRETFVFARHTERERDKERDDHHDVRGNFRKMLGSRLIIIVNIKIMKSPGKRVVRYALVNFSFFFSSIYLRIQMTHCA